jgi:hypothetical protein
MLRARRWNRASFQMLTSRSSIGEILIRLVTRTRRLEDAQPFARLGFGRISFPMNKQGKDLTKQAPRSPKTRVGGYVILGRTLDKCRALLWGNIGEYHFDCPLDNMLFGFKGVNAEDFKTQIEQGASDVEIVDWLNQSGQNKKPEEIKRWSEKVEASSLHDDLEKRDFFVEKTRKLGLDPAKTTTFEWLEIDDSVSHAQQAA